MNARFGGGLPLGIRAGADGPRHILARFLGLETGAPPLGEFAEGLRMTRFDDSFFLTEQDIAAYPRRGL